MIFSSISEYSLWFPLGEITLEITTVLHAGGNTVLYWIKKPIFQCFSWESTKKAAWADWRKGLTVTHTGCVHYFFCEEDGNSPKWAVCFFSFIVSKPLGKLDRLSTQRLEKLQVFCFRDAPASSGISACFGQQGAIVKSRRIYLMFQEFLYALIVVLG